MTKDCREMITNLNDFIDGALEPALCEEIKMHLGDCKDCQLMVNSLEQTVRLSCDGKDKELPPAPEKKLNDILRAKWEAKFGKQEG